MTHRYTEWVSRFSEEELSWVEQWRFAATALDEMRATELRTLTDAQAREILRRLMSSPRPLGEAAADSGLVEQQRLFHSKR